MLAWLLLTASVASADDCVPVSSEQVSSLMQQAVLDFATLDEESFGTSVAAAEQVLPCLSEVFLPPNAAAWHRLMGLKAFFDGEEEAAILAFRAAQAIEPGYELSAKIAPEGGKLSRLWTGARGGPNPFIASFNPPPGQYAYVDGRETRQRAEDLPGIVQFGPGDGTVRWTGYVPAGGRPPATLPSAAGEGGAEVSDWRKDREEAEEQVQEPRDSGSSRREVTEIRREAEPGEAEREEPRATRREAREDLADAPAPTPTGGGGGKGGLVAATILSGVATGGLYGGAALARVRFDRYPTQGGFWLTNGAYFGAIGCGALTVTFGSLAIFTGGGR